MKEYDPRMHSAEHILNQTMNRMFGCGRAFSAHIEKKKSKCDYHFARMLTMEECAAIEEEVNRVIQLDLPVHEEYLDRVKAAAHFNLSRLPDEAGETIRIISIGDYDACPCSGPHIMHTLEIGRFRIISNSHENGVLRLRFKIDDE